MTPDDTFKALKKYTFEDARAEWHKPTDLLIDLIRKRVNFEEKTGWTIEEYKIEKNKRYGRYTNWPGPR